MGAHDLEAEGDAVAFLIDSLDGILPRISESRSEMIMCLGDGRTEVLTTLRAFDGNLVCYRSIKRSSADKCIVRAQVERGLFDREDVSYEINDPFLDCLLYTS